MDISLFPVAGVEPIRPGQCCISAVVVGTSAAGCYLCSLISACYEKNVSGLRAFTAVNRFLHP